MMDWRDVDSPSPEQIRAFVHEHVRRNPKSDERYVVSGFRVKFGRPPLASEVSILREAYEDADVERQERFAAERAAEEARKPKGLYRLLAWGWQVKTTVGTALIVGGMYYFLGLEQTGQVLFYIVGVTQGTGLAPLVGVGWIVGHLIVGGLQKLTGYPGRAVLAAMAAEGR